MIFRTPFILPLLYSGLEWRVPTKEKKIFLTFDDGPVPGPTEFVLDTLKKSGIKATFFCIGDNVRKHPIVFSKIIKDGHTLGNHTFNHLNGWKSAIADYIDNVEQCTKQFLLAGYPSPSERQPLFRPPYGRIKRNQINALASYRIIMWDVLTHDYSASSSPEKCLRGSVAATRPGSIVVFHDSYKAEANLTYMLPRYLEHFSSMGFSFEALFSK